MDVRKLSSEEVSAAAIRIRSLLAVTGQCLESLPQAMAEIGATAHHRAEAERNLKMTEKALRKAVWALGEQT